MNGWVESCLYAKLVVVNKVQDKNVAEWDKLSKEEQDKRIANKPKQIELSR